jgi:hypothetical protein
MYALNYHDVHVSHRWGEKSFCWVQAKEGEGKNKAKKDKKGRE